MLHACRRVRHFAPKIEMTFIRLVTDHFEHVIAGKAKLVESLVGGVRSGAAEADVDDLERQFVFRFFLF